jgi:hypothetical protein
MVFPLLHIWLRMMKMHNLTQSVPTQARTNLAHPVGPNGKDA